MIFHDADNKLNIQIDGRRKYTNDIKDAIDLTDYNNWIGNIYNEYPDLEEWESIAETNVAEAVEMKIMLEDNIFKANQNKLLMQLYESELAKNFPVNINDTKIDVSNNKVTEITNKKSEFTNLTPNNRTCMLAKQEKCSGFKNDCIDCQDYIPTPTTMTDQTYEPYSYTNAKNYIINNSPLKIPNKRFCFAYQNGDCAGTRCDINTSNDMFCAFRKRYCYRSNCKYCFYYAYSNNETYGIFRNGHYVVCRNYDKK